MNKFVLAWFGVLVLFALACASSPQLRPGAANVRIVNDAPPEKEYRYLGEVSCEFGSNLRSQRENMKACRDELRNQALGMNAELVVLTSQSTGQSQCANCVTMFGEAYRHE